MGTASDGTPFFCAAFLRLWAEKVNASLIDYIVTTNHRDGVWHKGDRRVNARNVILYKFINKGFPFPHQLSAKKSIQFFLS